MSQIESRAFIKTLNFKVDYVCRVFLLDPVVRGFDLFPRLPLEITHELGAKMGSAGFQHWVQCFCHLNLFRGCHCKFTSFISCGLSFQDYSVIVLQEEGNVSFLCL